MAGTSAAVALVVLAASCGVESGAGARAAGVSEPVPDGWRHLVLCSDVGPVEVDVPQTVEFDGPRPPANISDPAIVTYAWGYTPGQVIRYDAFVMTDVGHYGETDREIARKVLKDLNGEPDQVRIRSMDDQADRAVGSYDERFDDRDYRFRFVAAGGTVVAVGVGIHDFTPPAMVRQAKDELDRMWHTVEVAGLDGAPTGECDGPSERPS